MPTVHLSSLIKRLPDGRSRARYLKLAAAAEVVLVVVTYADHPLFIVPDLATAGRLVSVGVSRAWIWTLDEIRDLLAVCEVTVTTVTEAARVLTGPHSPGA